MALPLYLALTPAEMAGNPDLPPQFAYLACHFSSCSPGLSNLPDRLPPDSMLILDDSTPMDGHDPEQILRELSAQPELHQYSYLLLDFQRPGIEAQAGLARLLVEKLPYPGVVSAFYAEGLSCPVFLPPAPPDMPLKEYISPRAGREIWLEAALDGLTLTLTESGCITALLPDFPGEGLKDDKLHCHYTIEAPATFHLWRTREDLEALLKEAEMLGVAKAVGLWQELGW